jgi:hypothetical protein
MTATYEMIATTTLGSNQTNITFSAISGSYTDLVLICHYASQLNNYNFFIRFNSDTGNNYSSTTLVGSASGATSAMLSNYSNVLLTQYVGAGTSLTYPGDTIAHIMNYSNTTTYKTVLARDNAVKNDSGMQTGATVGLWRNTAAITSITIGTNSGYLVSGTTATLYGIKAE